MGNGEWGMGNGEKEVEDWERGITEQRRGPSDMKRAGERLTLGSPLAGRGSYNVHNVLN